MDQLYKLETGIEISKNYENANTNFFGLKDEVDKKVNLFANLGSGWFAYVQKTVSGQPEPVQASPDIMPNALAIRNGIGSVTVPEPSADSDAVPYSFFMSMTQDFATRTGDRRPLELGVKSSNELNICMGNTVEGNTILVNYKTAEENPKSVARFQFLNGTKSLGASALVPISVKDPQIAQDAATKNYVDTLDANNVKLTGKNDQVIAGSISIQGDLVVHGTTTTENHESLSVKDNIIVTNSDGATLTNLSGLFIKTNLTDGYAIVYDPSSQAVILGQGTINEQTEVTIQANERKAIVTRKDSDAFTTGNLVRWNESTKGIEDSGINYAQVALKSEIPDISGKLDKVIKDDGFTYAYVAVGDGTQSTLLTNTEPSNRKDIARWTTRGTIQTLTPQTDLDAVNLKYMQDNYIPKQSLNDSHYHSAATITNDGNFSKPGSLTELHWPLFAWARANRFMFLPKECVTVESSDNGTSWQTVELSDTQVAQLFSRMMPSVDNPCKIGLSNETFNANSKLRITVTVFPNGVGSTQNRYFGNWNVTAIWVSTEGTSGMNVSMERTTIGEPDTWLPVVSNLSLSGWSGPNEINHQAITFGGNPDQTHQTAKVRFTFGITNVGSATTRPNVINIEAYSKSMWAYQSGAGDYMCYTDHLYKVDYDKRAVFPAAIYDNNSNSSRVYSQSFKPTANDVGAYPNRVIKRIEGVSEDLNNYNGWSNNTFGFYSVKVGVINNPAGCDGYLMLIPWDSNCCTCQLFFANDSNYPEKRTLYMRQYYSSGSWTDWVKFYSSATPPTAQDVNAILRGSYKRIEGEDEDLNNYTQPGFYNFKYNVKNNPGGATDDGVLLIFPWDDGVYVTQFVLTRNSNGTTSGTAFMRTRRPEEPSGWLNWVPIYTSFNPPTASDVGALPIQGGTVEGMTNFLVGARVKGYDVYYELNKQGALPVPDTRNENLSAEDYWHYSFGGTKVCYEFKLAATVGLTLDFGYGTLQTVLGYGDLSGGPPYQIFTSCTQNYVEQYIRFATAQNAEYPKFGDWGEWKLYYSTREQKMFKNGDNVTITQNTDGSYTFSATGGGSSEPYTATIGTANWAGSSGNYYFDIPYATHQKGKHGAQYDPEVTLYKVDGNYRIKIDGTYTYNVTTGDVSVRSNTNAVEVYVVIR